MSRKALIVTPLLMLVLASLAIAQYQSVPVEIKDSGESVRDLVYARAFTLEEPYTYHWAEEKEAITSGHILVLEVEPEYAKPRQVGVPVLYVGDTPAERANVGYESGYMIVIVPGHVDLFSSPIFFGSEELPEMVTKERGNEEMAAALDLGIKPFSREVVERALERGGDPLGVPASEELFLAIADLIDAYSPEDRDWADGYRVQPTR